MNNVFDQYEVWFVTGAQLWYGGDAVIAVDAHSNEMVNGLNESGKLPVKVVYKGTANSSKEVEAVFKAANNDDKCVGVITWMHTFSPAKMWIHGLQQLKKPLLHLHTQFNKEIPWDTMDMDFMNLNQSAHGDREFGHICTRMRIRRKVVVGYWKEEETLHKIAVWMRVCAGWADSQDMLIIRFGDQMNNVAVTDGDKVEAEQRMGYHVDYCPASELMEYHKDIKNADVDALVATTSMITITTLLWKTNQPKLIRKYGMLPKPSLLSVLSSKRKAPKDSLPTLTIWVRLTVAISIRFRDWLLNA